MLESLLVGCLSAVISSLVTYLITSLTYGNYIRDKLVKDIENRILSYIKIHEKIYHRHEMDTYVENKIREHSKVCAFSNTQSRVIHLLEYLVSSSGQDPNTIS